jgi:hypothetical protein
MHPTGISHTPTNRSSRNSMPLSSTRACIMKHSKNGMISQPSKKNFDAFSKHIVHAQNNLRNKKTSKRHGYRMAVEQMQELTQNFANMITTNSGANHYLIMRSDFAEFKAIISKLQQQPTPKRCANVFPSSIMEASAGPTVLRSTKAYKQNMPIQKTYPQGQSNLDKHAQWMAAGQNASMTIWGSQ